MNIAALSRKIMLWLGIWNISISLIRWLVLNSQFEIEKVLPLNLLEGDNITMGDGIMIWYTQQHA